MDVDGGTSVLGSLHEIAVAAARQREQEEEKKKDAKSGGLGGQSLLEGTCAAQHSPSVFGHTHVNACGVGSMGGLQHTAPGLCVGVLSNV